MPDFFSGPVLGGVFFAAIFVYAASWTMAKMWRGRQSRLHWVGTTARIQWFKLTHGFATVEYQYSVNGVALVGNKFIPSHCENAENSSPPPESAYLYSDGTLRFVSNCEVPVYYNPEKPTDSALSTGSPIDLWKELLGLLLLASLPFQCFKLATNQDCWFKSYPIALAGAAFGTIGLVFHLQGLKMLRRFHRSSSFPSAAGRLLKAEVIYASGHGSPGYVPRVEFDYEVDGRRHQSEQRTAISAVVLESSPKKVQPLIDRLRAEPTVTVYYDPKAPWDGFLEHGPSWGPYTVALMGLLFALLGLGIVILQTAELRQSPPPFHQNLR